MLTDTTLRTAATRAGLAATAAYPPQLFRTHLLDVYAQARRSSRLM